jgi:drug/metabolite transporter (DMT)-like permease
MNNVEAVITHPHRQHMSLGALFAIISAFSFAVMSVFVKKIGTDLPTSIPIFFRFAISYCCPGYYAALLFNLKYIIPGVMSQEFYRHC